MIANVFLDTNLLVYAAIGTGKDERKRQRSLELIRSEDFGTSERFGISYWDTAILSAAEALDVGLSTQKILTADSSMRRYV